MNPEQLEAVRKVAKKNPNVEALLKEYEELSASPQTTFYQPFLMASRKLCKLIAAGDIDFEKPETNGLFRIMEVGTKIFSKVAQVKAGVSHEKKKPEEEESEEGALLEDWASQAKAK